MHELLYLSYELYYIAIVWKKKTSDQMEIAAACVDRRMNGWMAKVGRKNGEE